MIYYLVLLLLILFALPSSSVPTSARVGAALVLLLAFGGLRHEVGADWFAYASVFEAVGSGSPFSELREENGYLSLNYLVATLGGGFGLFTFSAFALALSTKVYAVKKFGADVNVALFLYFSAILLIYDLNGLRQGLAMGFVMLAGLFAYQKRPLPFIGWMAAAASMHMVALTALPLYWMGNRFFYLQNPRHRFALLIAAGFGCFALGEVIASSSLSSYLALFNLLDRYDAYMDIFDAKFDPLGPGSIQRLVLMTVIAFTIDKAAASDRLKALLFNCHAAAFLLYFLLHFNMEFMARVSFFYKCFDLVTLPLILYGIKRFDRRLLFLAFLAGLAALQAFQILSIPDGNLIPYTNLASGTLF
jgi:hypothetical protein